MRKVIVIIIVALILCATTAVVVATNLKQTSIGDTRVIFTPVR